MVPLTALTQAWTSPEASLPLDDRSRAGGSGLGPPRHLLRPSSQQLVCKLDKHNSA